MKLCKSHALVIGGSKGIGRATVAELAAKLPNGSRIAFTGRNKTALDQTALKLSETFGKQSFTPIVLDLSDFNERNFDVFLRDFTEEMTDGHLLLVFCAFELGFCGPVSGLKPEQITSYMNNNITSLVQVYNTMNGMRKSVGAGFTVLNIGSHYGYPNYNYCASEWSLQCVGKSARDIVLQCAYLEEKTSSPFELFTFIPGIVNTGMLAKSIEEGGTPSTAESREPELIASLMIKSLFQNPTNSKNTVTIDEVL